MITHLETLLEQICRHIQWPVGHAYRVDPDHALGLFPTDIWFLADPTRFQRLVECTRATNEVAATSASMGTGLPRRVLKSRRAVWVPDLANDPRFLRGRLAEGELNVASGFAIPVPADEHPQFILEFFHEESLDLDPDLVDQVQKMANRHAGPLLSQDLSA